tara:strand:- start:150 stop:380 length:231 start_codon:yes stop_codon:yes gene_type:complete
MRVLRKSGKLEGIKYEYRSYYYFPVIENDKITHYAYKINYDGTIAKEPSFFDVNATGIFTFEQFAKFIDYMKSLTQ